MSRVLVTGGSGYLGGWCVAELLRHGFEVRTTVRHPVREREVKEKLAGVAGASERLELAVADLEDDYGWDYAVDGCEYVMHVASPFPAQQPVDPDELIEPARDGTLRVLEAAFDADVKRVVVTSSVAAVGGSTSHADAPLTEDQWTDPGHPKLTPYTRSKTMAELAAWEFVTDRGVRDRLAVVNPGAIIGPLLGGEDSTSLELVKRLLRGMPGIPRLGYTIVDVRDVADLHVRALTAPEAGGQRYLSVAGFRWMAEIAAVLREQLGEEAPRVPKRQLPDFAVRLAAYFDPKVRSVAGQLGRQVEMSSEKARTQLGWEPRPIEESIVDCARSLIAANAT